jgi:ribonuclease VapC
MFELVAPGKAELQAAFAAFVAYGRGSGHPAGLNYGDLPSAACRRWSFCPGKEPSSIAVWG